MSHGGEHRVGGFNQCSIEQLAGLPFGSAVEPKATCAPGEKGQRC